MPKLRKQGKKLATRILEAFYHDASYSEVQREDGFHISRWTLYDWFMKLKNWGKGPAPHVYFAVLKRATVWVYILFHQLYPPMMGCIADSGIVGSVRKDGEKYCGMA